MLCPYCGQTFLSYKGINKHLQTQHPTEFQYICLCGQTFQYRRGLSNHQKLCPREAANIYHPETKRIAREAQYSCDQCGRKYKEMAHLRAHIRNDHGGIIDGLRTIPTRD